MKTITNSMFDSENFKAFYKTIASDKKLAQKLAAMPEKYGVTVKDSKALAEECMEAVAEYKYARNLAHEGKLMTSLEESLNNCGSTYYERMHRLHRANFGLTQCAKDTDDLKNNIAKSEKDFNEYMKKDEESPATEEELKQSILNRISHSSLPSDDISSYIDLLNQTNSDLLRPSLKLSGNDFEVKCTVAMDAYLNGDDFDMHLAAYKACKETDLQNLSCAFKAGTVTGERIKDKIKNIGFVCGALGFAFLVSSFGYLPFIIIGVAGLVAGVAICCSSKPISDKFGILAAKLDYNASVVLNKIETIEVNHVDNVENTETHNQTLLLGQA